MRQFARHPSLKHSLVPIGTKLQQQIEQSAIAGLPDTIRFAPGSLSIRCRNMEHLVEQLVLIAQELDGDYEGIRLQLEGRERV